MRTLNRYQVSSILRYLDAAMADAVSVNTLGRTESNLMWCIRNARDLLLKAALADVLVEPVVTEVLVEPVVTEVLETAP